MDLYILRHGIAVERGTPGYENDAARPLTPRGEQRIRSMARALKRLGLEVDAIVSSPLVRARRTAEIVADVLDARSRLRLTAALAPEGDPAVLFRDLRRRYPAAKGILLVGHEPYLSSLISTLLAGELHVPMTLKKGGLCKLAIPHPAYGRCATLEWLVAPKLLR